MRKLLAQHFFNRPALKAAKDLIGKYLVRRYKDKTNAYMIKEVEAYVGPHDKASHASRGKTKRTEIMFGEAGNFYIYLIYGMYWMLNVVTDKNDYPSAILIRGLEGISGPGRLTKALKIGKKLNGKEAVPQNGLWFEDRGIRIPKRQIKRTPRIGVSYAGKWAEKPYRFVLR